MIDNQQSRRKSLSQSPVRGGVIDSPILRSPKKSPNASPNNTLSKLVSLTVPLTEYVFGQVLVDYLIQERNLKCLALLKRISIYLRFEVLRKVQVAFEKGLVEFRKQLNGRCTEACLQSSMGDAMSEKNWLICQEKFFQSVPLPRSKSCIIKSSKIFNLEWENCACLIHDGGPFIIYDRSENRTAPLAYKDIEEGSRNLLSFITSGYIDETNGIRLVRLNS